MPDHHRPVEPLAPIDHFLSQVLEKVRLAGRGHDPQCIH
jgi:hypothetical protein